MRSPFSGLNLSGDSTMRGVTLEVEKDCVQNFLPVGLELGTQWLTKPRFHPVMLFFNEMFRAQMSVPTLIPSMTYHEHHVGIPFTYLSSRSITPGARGPYYFMTKLYLDHLLAVLGGIAFWGFAKEMASFTVTADCYTVMSYRGERLASLTWRRSEGGVFGSIGDYPHFKPIQEILDQTLISMVPASVGPFFVLSDFEKLWNVATLLPLKTDLDIHVEYVQGQKCARHGSDGIDVVVSGSYELRVPWRLSLPYPPVLAF